MFLLCAPSHVCTFILDNIQQLRLLQFDWSYLRLSSLIGVLVQVEGINDEVLWRVSHSGCHLYLSRAVLVKTDYFFITGHQLKLLRCCLGVDGVSLSQNITCVLK